MSIYTLHVKSVLMHGAESLPAVEVGPSGDLGCGTGDDPGSEGDPVTAVSGSGTREYSG